MLSPAFRSGRFLLAAFICLSLSMCKKSVNAPPVDPDTIIETENPDLIAVTKPINDAFGGYYISLPHHYEQTRKRYPILFFFHGLGQTGNGSTDLHYLLEDGIGKVLNEQRFPPHFVVNGDTSSFIVVNPQYDSLPTTAQITQFMVYVMQTYRADQKRLYVAGLSQGARITSTLAGTYADQFAAIVPISGVTSMDNIESKCEVIAQNNLPVWAFHNEDDPLAPLSDAVKFIDLIKADKPAVEPRMTIFNVYGHDAWTKALDPGYKENGMNIYEWMLQYSRQKR